MQMREMSQALPSKGSLLDSGGRWGGGKHFPLVLWVVIEVSPGGNGSSGAQFG